MTDRRPAWPLSTHGRDAHATQLRVTLAKARPRLLPRRVSVQFPSAFTPFVLGAEIVFLLYATVWLVRRRTVLPSAFLGLSTTRVGASAYNETQVFLAFVFSFGAAFLAMMIGGLSGLLPMPPKGEVGIATAINALVFQAVLLAGLAHAWFWHLRKTPQPPRSPENPRLPPPRILRAAFVTFAICLLVAGGVSVLWAEFLTWTGFEVDSQEIVRLLVQKGDLQVLGCLLLGAVVFAPITEEILFRVLLFRWFRTRVSRSIALLLPAIVFGLAHFSVSVLLPLCVMGVILALAYERTGEPAVPILAHAMFNLNTLLLVLAGVAA